LKDLDLSQAQKTDSLDSAIKGLIEVQQAIEVIDIAVEELEEAELEEELVRGAKAMAAV